MRTRRRHASPRGAARAIAPNTRRARVHVARDRVERGVVPPVVREEAVGRAEEGVVLRREGVLVGYFARRQVEGVVGDDERVTTEKYFNGKAEPEPAVVEFVAEAIRKRLPQGA